jgi:hypothetical protein
MRGRWIARLALCTTISLVPVTAAAQTPLPAQTPQPAPADRSMPSASASPGHPPGHPDLLLDMPYYLGGFEPDIVMTRGAEHVATLDADDPTRMDLEAFLDAVEADIEDMDSGYALVSLDDFFAFVVAIRVAGVEPGSLLPAYLPTLLDDLVDASSVTANVSGKDVVVISSVGADYEYVDLYVYDQGDTIWMVQGPEDVVEVTLDGLPDPR